MLRTVTLLKIRQGETLIVALRLKHLSSQPKSTPDGTHSSTLDRIRAELIADKEKLKWRKPIGERPGDWNSKLKVFENSEQTSDYIIAMQKPINLGPRALKEWWRKRNERLEKHMQQYIPERHEILGPELAAAHFLLYRGGAVKFLNERGWMRANEDREFNLPKKYHPAFKVEALRCDNMTLYYEGLENLRNLEELKFLSLHNVPTFDDWCLDRVSGSGYTKLEVLDISGTSCTVNGLSCLYRIPTLKLLIVDDPKATLEYELAYSMLQEVIPNLKIVGASSIHDLKAN
ncbi:distal membrane-arm assembly complex protein 2 isoform X2 [Rhagoletis pomonella]|uniref:distal membrane-arm assembly complex protein 2 isoform X2 n=1 Tax=Rhagoletis pomonella TaxID=28610 RepID=UPI00177E325E|nr:distal membrane-arm assembly complex protein 2 isoform X2 [Rhagoletis pomonella]